MKVAEIRALGTEEVVKQLQAAHKELFDLRFRLTTKQLVNHREVHRVKKSISRLKTVMRERELNPKQA